MSILTCTHGWSLLNDDLCPECPTLTPKQRENWRRVLSAQLGIVPSDEYIDKYRAALQARLDRGLG